jgi:HEAT repeat protein
VPDAALERAAHAAGLGVRGRLPRGSVGQLEQWARADPDPRVRAAALGALVRGAGAGTAGTAWRGAVADPDAAVRRRATELAPAIGPTTARALVARLADDDVTVTETAAWALGELGPVPRSGATRALARVARDHPDALAREAAVAALGALGDPAGLPAILAACTDKPAVRRRAVLALAPFTGEAVDAALQNALEDRDWQTRQAAEDLLAE